MLTLIFVSCPCVPSQHVETQLHLFAKWPICGFSALVVNVCLWLSHGLSDVNFSLQMWMSVWTARCVAVMGSVKTWMAPTAVSVTKGTRTHRMGTGVQVSSVTAPKFRGAKPAFQQNAFHIFVFCHFLLTLCRLLVKKSWALLYSLNFVPDGNFILYLFNEKTYY